MKEDEIIHDLISASNNYIKKVKNMTDIEKVITKTRSDALMVKIAMNLFSMN